MIFPVACCVFSFRSKLDFFNKFTLFQFIPSCCRNGKAGGIPEELKNCKKWTARLRWIIFLGIEYFSALIAFSSSFSSYIMFFVDSLAYYWQRNHKLGDVRGSNWGVAFVIYWIVFKAFFLLWIVDVAFKFERFSEHALRILQLIAGRFKDSKCDAEC